jgi:1,4-dihydroxy-2-naphthoate octaprenyltransferase
VTTVADQVEALRRLPRPALWVFAARLKTLGLSLTPVLGGTWLAAIGGQWRPLVMAAALVSAAAIQVGTNLWNDAADAQSGIDRGERLGPPRMTALGLLGAGEVRAAAAIAFAVAGLSGLFLVTIGGWPILAIGLASLALGYLYSMGPRPLSATPIGELLVIAFFGVLAVSGTAWLNGAEVTPAVLWTGFFLGLPAASVLLVNNHRDRASDAAGGRRTLAILIGQGPTRALFGILNVAAWAGLWLLFAACWEGAAAMVPALGFASYLAWRMYLLPVSRALNSVLAATALYQFMLLVVVALAEAVCR